MQVICREISMGRNLPRPHLIRRPCVLALLSLLMMIPGFTVSRSIAAPVNPQSENYFNEAKTFLEQGEFNAAIIQLKNSIKSDLNNVEARLELARLYIVMGDGASAEKELKSARDRGMDPGRVAVLLGRAYLMQRKATELIDELQPNVVSGNDRALLLVIRANAAILLEDEASAEKEILQALNISDELPEVLLAYSTLLQRQKKLAEAEAQIDRLLELAPENAQAQYSKGDLLRMRSENEDAITYYSNAIELEPRDFRSRIGRALSYISTSRIELADNDIEAVFERDPENALAKYVRSLILSGQGKNKEALDMLISAKGIDMFTPALYLLGSLHFLDGQLATARDYIERYIREIPDNSSAQFLLAAIEARQNNLDTAIDLLEPLYQANPDNYQVLALLANSYAATGRLIEAAPLLDKALTFDPTNQQLLLRLVQSGLGSGNIDDAVVALERATQEDPNAESAYAMLVLIHVRTGDEEQARSAARKMQTNIPDSGLPYNLLAAIDLSEGNIDAARKNLEKAVEVQGDFYPALLNLARIDRREGNNAAAQARYEYVLQQQTGNLQAMIGLADIKRAEGDIEGSLAVLRDASNANPDNAEPAVLQVNALLLQDRVETAIVKARETRDKFPNNTLAIDALARAQEANGEFASAAATYRYLASLQTNSPQAQVGLGNAQLRLKNYEEAALAFDRAIELSPQSLVYKLQRALIENELNGLDSALDMAERMREEIDDPIDGSILVGDVLYRGGDYERALENYESAWAGRKERPILLQFYRSLNRLSRSEEGVKLLEDWLENNPDDNEVRFYLSGAAITKGDYGNAISQSEELLEKDPENALVLNNLAWLYDQQGERDKALDYAKRAYDLRSDLPEIADTLGWLLIAIGETAQGLELLLQANKGRPENAEIGYHYAVALNLSGEREEARIILQDVVKSEQEYDGSEEALQLFDELTE